MKIPRNINGNLRVSNRCINFYIFANYFKCYFQLIFTNFKLFFFINFEIWTYGMWYVAFNLIRVHIELSSSLIFFVNLGMVFVWPIAIPVLKSPLNFIWFFNYKNYKNYSFIASSLEYGIHKATNIRPWAFF